MTKCGIRFINRVEADDTTGTAAQLRYILDPTIEHPALELVFTVQEEVGLKGAEQ